MVIMNEKTFIVPYYYLFHSTNWLYTNVYSGCTAYYSYCWIRHHKNKRFQGTILFPEYTHGVKSKPETQSTSARSLETIASRLNAKSPHNVVVGQMRVVLFGKALGERGMGEIITNLQRDPNIGRDVQLAIVDGSAEELLNYGKKMDRYILLIYSSKI